LFFHFYSAIIDGEKLSHYSTISILNAYRTLLYLLIILKTTDTFKTFFVQALIDSGATRIFINRNYVNKHQTNIYKLFYPILVYNINNISNKASQIDKVVNIILYYKCYSEPIFLTVSSLDKQNLKLYLAQII